MVIIPLRLDDKVCSISQNDPSNIFPAGTTEDVKEKKRGRKRVEDKLTFLL